MNFEIPEQLKRALADYGVAYGYQFWYYRTDYKSMIVYYGRDVSFSRGLIEYYGKLLEYSQAIFDSNRGSTCHMDVNVLDNKMTHFDRFYMCFKGVKDGWIASCRRVIGIYGCFITHMCNDQLLTAMERDGNNQMYQIAWEMVDVENKNNWCWFLSLLVEDLNLENGLALTVISDAHKALIFIDTYQIWFTYLYCLSQIH
ncbi:hypothetical protein Tco_1165597 [Tanacetum coccineum]